MTAYAKESEIATTLAAIREHDPCVDSWKALLHGMSKTGPDDEPLPFHRIVAVCGLDEALWATRAAPQYDREWCLFAVACARDVQHLMTDPRSVQALDLAERFANGDATLAEVDVAWTAARAASAAARAAWAASGASAAASAAWDASAAASAASAAASAASAAWDASAAASAARDAASAAWAAAIYQQQERFLDLVGRGHECAPRSPAGWMPDLAPAAWPPRCHHRSK